MSETPHIRLAIKAETARLPLKEYAGHPTLVQTASRGLLTVIRASYALMRDLDIFHKQGLHRKAQSEADQFLFGVRYYLDFLLDPAREDMERLLAPHLEETIGIKL